jgi:hypothetical protein
VTYVLSPSAAYLTSFIKIKTHLSLGCSLHGGHLLVERENIRHRAQRRDSERVDLAMTLGVVLLDVCELSRAAESLVVPIQVAHPPEKFSISNVESNEGMDDSHL